MDKKIYIEALNRALKDNKGNKENIEILEELKKSLENWTEDISLWTVEKEGYVFWLSDNGYLKVK